MLKLPHKIGPSCAQPAISRLVATPLLDVRRIEVLVFNFEPADLREPTDLERFVGSIYTVSDGNPNVLPILVMAFREWQEFDNEVAVAELERIWNSFEFEQPIKAALSILKAFCISQPIPIPPCLERAIFDPSSSFAEVYREFRQNFWPQYRNKYSYVSDGCGDQS